MSETPDPRKLQRDLNEKTAQILEEFLGEKAELFQDEYQGNAISKRIQQAIGEGPDDKDAYDIGFHLTDWIHNMGFLVALHLQPTAFSSDEIKAGVTQFLIHAPNHVAAAAKLAGQPVTDIFNVGAIDGAENI